MASKPIYQTVVVSNGVPVPSAEYTVTNENSGLPLTIYSDRAGSAKAAPYFADADGVIQFYTDAGALYRVAATGPGGTYTDRYVRGIEPQTTPSDTDTGALIPVGADGPLGSASRANLGSGSGDVPTNSAFGTAAAADVGDFATAAQGAKADTALQSGAFTPVTGYSPATAYYVRDFPSGAVSLTGAIAQGSTGTVGPTGSGADLVWPDLDVVPLAAKALWLQGFVQLSSTATDSISCRLTVGNADLANERVNSSSSDLERITGAGFGVAVLDGANTFTVAYDGTGVSETMTALLKVVGFHT